MKKQATISGPKSKKVKRKGIHAKKKHSNLKTSKNYKKRYNAQGR